MSFTNFVSQYAKFDHQVALNISQIIYIYIKKMLVLPLKWNLASIHVNVLLCPKIGLFLAVRSLHHVSVLATSTWSEPSLNVLTRPQVDMHSVHFHGQILTLQNHHTDTVSLFPASSIMAEMMADNHGDWLLTCNVNDHFMGELTHDVLSPNWIIVSFV